ALADGHDFAATNPSWFLAILIVGLYLLGVFRQRRPGEPPLDKGLIPWLGHGLEFCKDTIKFLEKMKQKYSDVFMVQLGGNYITFIIDPLSFGAFVKDSQEKLDFNMIARKLLHRVFGYKLLGNEHKIIMKSSYKHLRGPGLEVLTHSMMCNLQNVMLQNIGSSAVQKTWLEDSLYKLVTWLCVSSSSILVSFVALSSSSPDFR
uniref:Uncharacterized protein n=1 Tax=Sander lucioperca TaxID=283035 RepID=A0A8D0APG5_SANLU